MQFTGEFETHITVSLPYQECLPSLQQWAAGNDLKCTHIVLERGSTVSQPMLSYRGVGCLTDQIARANELRDRLVTLAFNPNRIKIEASPQNEGIPQSDEQAADHPPQRYFEHHVKLLMEAGQDLLELSLLAQRHGARLSRNALRIRDDAKQERFVTQRCHGVGWLTARQEFEFLRSALVNAGQQVVDSEAEFVVYDSNLELDAGWLDRSPGGLD